jgi:lysophospholipase L1-like esterase
LAVNIKVIVGKPVPYNASDLTWMNTILDTICATRSIKTVDLFTALKGGGTGLNALYDIGDGCHPN